MEYPRAATRLCFRWLLSSARPTIRVSRKHAQDAVLMVKTHAQPMQHLTQARFRKKKKKKLHGTCHNNFCGRRRQGSNYPVSVTVPDSAVIFSLEGLSVDELNIHGNNSCCRLAKCHSGGLRAIFFLCARRVNVILTVRASSPEVRHARRLAPSTSPARCTARRIISLSSYSAYS